MSSLDIGVLHVFTESNIATDHNNRRQIKTSEISETLSEQL